MLIEVDAEIHIGQLPLLQSGGPCRTSVTAGKLKSSCSVKNLYNLFPTLS